MITFLRHNNIDKTKWDNCLKNSQYPIVYAESWYLDVVSPNWSAYVVKSGEEYTAIFPLTEKYKIGISYLVQPPFCQQLGLFYTEEIDVNLILELVVKKYRLVEIALNHTLTINSDLYSVIAKRNYEMRLIADYEKTYSNYNSNRKRDLKKANKQQVYLKETTDIGFFVDFFMREKGGVIKELSNGMCEVLKNIYAAGVRQSAVKLIFVYNLSHKVCAAGLFLIRNQRIIFLLGTSDEEGQKNGSMTLLMDYLIRENSNKEKVLDFEGSMILGVAKFYESLGGKEKKYISLKANRLPSIVRFLKNRRGA